MCWKLHETITQEAWHDPNHQKTAFYILSFIPPPLMAPDDVEVTYMKSTELTAQQVESTRSNMMAMKEKELKAYLQMAQSSISPFLEKEVQH